MVYEIAVNEINKKAGRAYFIKQTGADSNMIMLECPLKNYSVMIE